MIGSSPGLLSVIRAARLVASADVSTLIRGESGTGKELLARMIHSESQRADKCFVAINCAALPESLAESLLFGHRKGAFTGATDAQPGVIKSANGGTLFLDEIGELPHAVQSKLLRFLESGECLAVGDTAPFKVNVRIISATNRDLYEESRDGRFRMDLFFRLNVVPLELPPLRDRLEDLDAIMSSFISSFASENSLEAPAFSPEAMDVLRRHSWPGNIRELRNFCQRMTILLSGKVIMPENLPMELKSQAKDRVSATFSLLDLGMGLKEMEEELIRQALARTDGNRSQAARMLGVTRDTLLYR
ncbi:MAG: sigma-54 dependent transcriptional regulator, partial [Nitrospinota bacterium]|nr:sigma-54 dependent transcriptional regulator [Nitrospinota bacterium]